MASESRTAVYVGIAANLLIAATKFGAAAVTNSSAMVAEGVHSLVDSGDGMLLLLGAKRSARPPDETHPLGHGKELYFWALIVAVLFFALGGGMSFYEGIQHIMHPEPVSQPKWNYIVLGFSFVFTLISFGVAFRAFRKRLAGRGYWTAFRQSKDPTLFTLILEDVADIIGLVLAFFGVFLSHVLNKPYLDGIASMAIGAVMTVVAILLVRESKGLLIGEGATSVKRETIRNAALADPAVSAVRKLITMYFGPDTLLVAMDVDFSRGLDTNSIGTAINRMESRVKESTPEVEHIYIEAKSLTSQSGPTPSEARKN